METHMMKKQMSLAYRYSYAQLALNFYSYFEAGEESNTTSVQLEEYKKELASVLTAYVKQEDCTKQVKALRSKITETMDMTISYAECFQIYEYVFNRLERKFSPVKDIQPKDDELLAEIRKFFASSADNMVLNDRIRAIIGEVPIRFTQTKFFSLLKEGLTAYAGSSKKTFENCLRQLHTFTINQISDSSKTEYKTLTLFLQELAALDYKNLTAEQFETSLMQIQEAGEELAFTVDQLLMGQQLVNALYILCLSREDAVIEVNEEEAAKRVVTGILQLIEDGISQIPEEIDHQLVILEGIQEICFERYTALTASEPDGRQGSDMEKRLWMVDRLMSNSPFLSLDSEENSDIEEMTDEAWISRRSDAFSQELSIIFSSLPKPVVRAIMAKMLSGLPLWFHSIDEISDYIKDGLSSCLEPAEKESSIELICKIMETEYALV